jgi:hypothetical protein
MVPSNGVTRSTVASSPCLQQRCLGNERGAVWRHRDMLCSKARCGSARYGTAFNLPRLETARSKHRFPYCRVACLQTSVSLRLLHGVNTSQYYIYIYMVSRDSAVGIATSYWLDDRGVGVRVPVGLRLNIFSFPCRPHRLWGPPNLLSNGYRGCFLGGKAAGTWSWPLTSN